MRLFYDVNRASVVQTKRACLYWELYGTDMSKLPFWACCHGVLLSWQLQKP